MQTTDKPIEVTRFRIISNLLQFMRAEVWINGRHAFVLADFEKGTIKVSWQGGSLNLTLDAYNQNEGDFCDFLARQLGEKKQN